MPTLAGMPIVAKFRCNGVTRWENGGETVKMAPVYGQGNEEWAKATPFGSLEMTIDNPRAQGQIEPGRDYLVTIEAAPVEPSGR